MAIISYIRQNDIKSMNHTWSKIKKRVNKIFNPKKDSVQEKEYLKLLVDNLKKFKPINDIYDVRYTR